MIQGEVISWLLILVGCVLLIWLFYWLVYRIPLRLDLFFSNKQNIINFYLNIGWGPLNVRILRSDSGWQIEGRYRHTVLVSRPMIHRISDPDPVTQNQEKSDTKDLFRFLPLIRRIIPEVIRHITLDTISADITFGAGDPVITGCTYGYYHALRPLIPPDRGSITLTPDFDQIVLTGTLKAGIRITTPADLLIRGVRFAFPVGMQLKKSFYV